MFSPSVPLAANSVVETRLQLWTVLMLYMSIIMESAIGQCLLDSCCVIDAKHLSCFLASACSCFGKDVPYVYMRNR